LIEFYLIETEGDKFLNFLSSQIGEIKVIEHFHSFYRLKAAETISVGKMFGLFETNKANLKISQYSIKQSTIEQIFNMFATN